MIHSGMFKTATKRPSLNISKINKRKITCYKVLFYFLIHYSTNCMDSEQSNKHKFNKDHFLKFRLGIKHAVDYYNIEIYIPCDYISYVSDKTIELKNYIQFDDYNHKIVITIKRKEYKQNNLVYKSSKGVGNGLEVLRSINDCINDLIKKLTIHIDSYLVSYILKDRLLSDESHRLRTIKGVWKQDLFYPGPELDLVEFKGIYQSDVHKFENNASSSFTIYLPYSKDKEEKRLEGETMFQITEELLTNVHRDLFKNDNITFYKYKLELIVDQLFDSMIYIHKRCLNILRLFKDEPKDYEIAILVGTQHSLNVPFMCYFHVLGQVRDHFKETKIPTMYLDYFNVFSIYILELFKLLENQKERENIAVGVMRNYWFMMIKTVLEGENIKISSCDILENKKIRELNTEKYNKISTKIHETVLIITDIIFKEQMQKDN